MVSALWRGAEVGVGLRPPVTMDTPAGEVMGSIQGPRCETSSD